MIDYRYWQSQVRMHRAEGAAQWLGMTQGDYAVMIGTVGESADVEAFMERKGFVKTTYLDWLFRRVGEVVVDKRGCVLDEDGLMLIGLGAGLKEVYFDDGNLAVFRCRENQLEEIAAILFLEDVEIREATVAYEPTEIVPIYDREEAERLWAIMEELSKEEGVADICTNFAFMEGLEERSGEISKKEEICKY